MGWLRIGRKTNEGCKIFVPPTDKPLVLSVRIQTDTNRKGRFSLLFKGSEKIKILREEICDRIIERLDSGEATELTEPKF